MLTQPPSARLQDVAHAFVELQQARHEADYDLAGRFSRDDVLVLIEMAGHAFTAFEGLDSRDIERRVFLVGLVFHGRWGRA